MNVIDPLYKQICTYYISLCQNIRSNRFIAAIPESPDDNIKTDEFGTARLVNVPSTLLTPYHEKNGKVAIIVYMFADSILGFCFVRIKDGKASTQQAVTNCEYYKHFTTKTPIHDALPSIITLVES